MRTLWIVHEAFRAWSMMEYGAAVGALGPGAVLKKALTEIQRYICRHLLSLSHAACLTVNGGIETNNTNSRSSPEAVELAPPPRKSSPPHSTVWTIRSGPPAPVRLAENTMARRTLEHPMSLSATELRM